MKALVEVRNSAKWFNPTLVKPAEDCEVIACYSQSRIVRTMNYTVEGGWNTHVDLDGMIDKDTAVEDDLIHGWMPMPDPVEDTE